MPIRPDYNDVNTEAGLIGLGSIPGMAPVAAFNPEMTENLLKTKGLKATHYKAAHNPDRETIAGGVNPNSVAAKLGRRYYQARQLFVVPQQFKLDNRLQIQGIWGMSSVLLNLSGSYSDGDQATVFARPHDIITIESTVDGSPITALADQLVEFNPTGPMKLNFRCENVDYLADKNRSYVLDQDFCVQDGKIYWLNGGNRPSFANGKGDILTVVYWIKPIYIIQNVPHSIRITPGNNTGNGGLPRKSHYAPQLAIASQAWFRIDSEELMDFNELPSYNHYASTNNVTGGS